MKWINKMILKSRCSEMVEIYRKVLISGARNSIRTELQHVGKYRVSVQNTGSVNKVAGLTLQNNKAGTQVQSVWIMYSDWIDLREQDLIKRSDGLYYEVQNLEPNGRGSPLEHMKSYLSKVENQDEL